MLMTVGTIPRESLLSLLRLPRLCEPRVVEKEPHYKDPNTFLGSVILLITILAALKLVIFSESNTSKKSVQRAYGDIEAFFAACPRTSRSGRYLLREPYPCKWPFLHQKPW